MISEIRRIIFISGEHGSRLKRPSIDHMLNIRTNGRCFILNKQVKIFFPGPSILSIANRAGGGGGRGGAKGTKLIYNTFFGAFLKIMVYNRLLITRSVRANTKLK